MKKPSSYAIFPTTTPTFSLRQGMILVDGGTLLVLETKLNATEWILRNTSDNTTKKVSEHAVYAGLMTYRIQEHNEPKRFFNLGMRMESQVAVLDMEHKKMWLEHLRAMGVSKIKDVFWIRRLIEELARGALKDIKRFSVYTLAETQRKLRSSENDWTQVVPNYSQRGGPGITRLANEVEAVIKSSLDSSRNQKKQLIVKKQIAQSIQTQIETINIGRPDAPLKVPSLTTICRRIDKEIGAYEIALRKQGERQTKRDYRNNSAPRNQSHFPLLISEYDDIDSSVFLIDERTGLPFGRGYLTHGVCQNAKVVLGYSVGHESRSYDSALRAIVNSLLPKDPSVAEYSESKWPWVGHGVQGEILLDNATYNNSQQTRHAAKGLNNLLISLTRPYGPTEKSDIEHYNHIVKSDFCPTLPGFRGDKDDPDAVKNGMATAILTVQQFRKLYFQWVTGVYQNKPGEDGYTPRQRWEMHFKAHSPPIRWTYEQLELLSLRAENDLYTFRASGGVLRLGLTYDSEELNALRLLLGASNEVQIYYSSENLSAIYVKSPYQTDLLKVPCVNPAYSEGLTNLQQQLILKIARDRGRKNPSIREMVEARQILARMVEQDSKSNKLRIRQKAARTGYNDVSESTIEDILKTENSNASKGHETTVVMTELEYSIEQLGLIDVSDLERGWA